MIELRDDSLHFSFPEVHEHAKLGIHFQRTLRIPDDGKTYPLPPGLGRFPLRHVDDFARSVPSRWLRHGGVMLPMYQAEALWVAFERGGWVFGETGYPFAVKVATGKVNAVTGETWKDGLTARPQDYLAVPSQPWLDGYCVEKRTIRQFVAMPLGTGYSAEEQLTGAAEHGGLQLVVYPMRAEAYERLMAKARRWDVRSDVQCLSVRCAEDSPALSDMGIAPGGRMKQELVEDPHPFQDWDERHSSRCFVHVANSETWTSITGEAPPTRPPSARRYATAGLPWFDHYAEGTQALSGSEKLAGMDSVASMGTKRGESPLPENETCTPQHVVKLRSKLAPDQVREGSF